MGSYTVALSNGSPDGILPDPAESRDTLIAARSASDVINADMSFPVCSQRQQTEDACGSRQHYRDGR